MLNLEARKLRRKSEMLNSKLGTWEKGWNVKLGVQKPGRKSEILNSKTEKLGVKERIVKLETHNLGQGRNKSHIKWYFELETRNLFKLHVEPRT